MQWLAAHEAHRAAGLSHKHSDTVPVRVSPLTWGWTPTTCRRQLSQPAALHGIEAGRRLTTPNLVLCCRMQRYVSQDYARGTACLATMSRNLIQKQLPVQLSSSQLAGCMQ